MPAWPSQVGDQFWESTGSRWAIVAWTLLFCVCLWPWAASFVTHHPDERHYTDAAMEMVRRGDYLTPYTADGSLRLKKPIVPYWMTAASFRVLGIAPWSARFPFLLLSGGLVWLTWTLARRVLHDRRWAFLAAVMVACQPALVISAPRSVPDVPLAFFLLVAAVGFVSLMGDRRAAWTDLALAYGGCALAVLSKGLPAVVFCGYALGFLLVVPSVRRGQRWSRHALALGACIVLSASWFAVMYGLHGDQLTSMLYRDQVGGRMARSAGQCLRQLLTLLAFVALTFAPWVVPLAVIRYDVRSLARRLLGRPQHLFLLGWIGLWIGLASLVLRVNLRYLLPIVPLVSVLVADAWRDADPLRLLRALRPEWCLSLAALAVTTVAGAGSLAYAGHGLLGVMLVAIVGGVLLVLLRASRGADARRLAGLGVMACLTALAIVAVGLMPWALPDTGARIAQELKKLPLREAQRRHVLFVGPPAVAARTRVFLHGDISLLSRYHLHAEDLAQAEVVVVPAGTDLGAEWSPVANPAHACDKPDLSTILRAAARGELAEHLALHRAHSTIAVRRASSPPFPVQTVSWIDDRSHVRPATPSPR